MSVAIDGANPVPKTETCCTHCRLPVPAARIVAASREQFCCSGCAVAYDLIRGSGLDEYYSIVESKPGLFQDIDDDSGGFREFDSTAFIESFGKIDAEGNGRITLMIEGIHCAACVWLIEKLPQIVEGVQEVRVNWTKRTVSLAWNQNQALLSQIATTLLQLGYRPHPFRVSDQERIRQSENRKYLVLIGVAGAAAGNNMLIAAALYLGMFSTMAPGIEQLLRYASAVVGIVSFLWPGRIFLIGAVNAIRTRTAHMDLPIALALVIGTVSGLVNAVRGSGEIYFDSLSVLVFLLIVGRWLQYRQQTRAANAIDLFHQLTPKFACRLIDGRQEKTLVDLIAPGDHVRVKAGELFPVDGEILSGFTTVDQSVLTGESIPVSKACGDRVEAGTQNVQSAVEVETRLTGELTRIGRIAQLVEQADSRRPRVVQWANRMGGWFVLTILMLAVLTLAIWLFVDPGRAIDHAIALLVVACPCALALATPLALSVSIGRLAKRKTLVKDGDVFQSLERPGMIWLDKTGTITRGRLRLLDWQGDADVKRVVASIETHSIHPVARALTESFDVSRLPRVEQVRHSGRGGISAVFEGREFAIGSQRFMEEKSARLPEHLLNTAVRFSEDGSSPCFVAVDGVGVAVAAIGDEVRPDAVAAIEILKSKGWQVGILSGDHRSIVGQIGSRVGIDPERTFGEQAPEQKMAKVLESQREFETVVMVGDGINDSAALAASNVGIAVSNGAEKSLEAAPVYLGQQGLLPIVDLLEAGQSTRRTIQRNLWVSLFYNSVGATLAITGLINPLVAAILMPISSLTVVSLSIRSGVHRSRPGTERA